MRILSAFTNSLGGQDAYSLAATLSDSLGWPMDLVTVVRGGPKHTMLEVSDHAFQDVVVKQAEAWMEEAIARQPPALPVSKHLLYHDSYPEGLIESAVELGAGLLVAGGGRHGVMGRVSLGSVGLTLLNSAPVPVALAPRGTRHNPARAISRITVMLGESGDWKGLLATARTFAQQAGVPLRLVTVVTDEDQEDAAVLERTEGWLDEVRMDVSGLEDRHVKIVRSASMSAAVVSMKWRKHELALLGSARLAQRGRLLLGANANKIMRSLPVPLVAVPAGHMSAGPQGHGRGDEP